MIKQGIKTVNAEFIQTRALSQFSFLHFRPYANSLQGFLLTLTLMPKSKKTLETSLDLTPSRSRPPFMQGLTVLFQMSIIWKIGTVILF